MYEFFLDNINYESPKLEGTISIFITCHSAILNPDCSDDLCKNNMANSEILKCITTNIVILEKNKTPVPLFNRILNDIDSG